MLFLKREVRALKTKSRDGPSFADKVPLRDFHKLIEQEIVVYFRKEGRIGAEQIEKGYLTGVITSVSCDGDRKEFIFEIGVGPKYNRIFMPFCEEDIDLPRALKDLRREERQESEHQA